MTRMLVRWCVVVCALLAAPALASAQSLAGTVRDTSGAVLPGVTIEASSPALITKVRSGVSDDAGQYRIPDLPPGEYDVTIHDDKGPPGDLTYSFLETTAYVVFPPVWPFVFRSNQAQFKLRVLPKD